MGMMLPLAFEFSIRRKEALRMSFYEVLSVLIAGSGLLVAVLSYLNDRKNKK